jgi:hypothetical protein
VTTVTKSAYIPDDLDEIGMTDDEFRRRYGCRNLERAVERAIARSTARAGRRR